MTTKYTNQFVYVSFVEKHWNPRISKPTDLSKFFSGGFRNPNIVLYIGNYFIDIRFQIFWWLYLNRKPFLTKKHIPR